MWDRLKSAIYPTPVWPLPRPGALDFQTLKPVPDMVHWDEPAPVMVPFIVASGISPSQSVASKIAYSNLPVVGPTTTTGKPNLIPPSNIRFTGVNKS